MDTIQGFKTSTPLYQSKEFEYHPQRLSREDFNYRDHRRVLKSLPRKESWSRDQLRLTKS